MGEAIMSWWQTFWKWLKQLTDEEVCKRVHEEQKATTHTARSTAEMQEATAQTVKPAAVQQEAVVQTAEPTAANKAFIAELESTLSDLEEHRKKLEAMQLQAQESRAVFE